jgi:chorismate synthase
MTAPLCIAGGIAIQMLKERGIHVGAHIVSVGKIQDEGFDSVHVQASELNSLKAKDFPVLNDVRGELMKKEIIAAMEEHDSVGGIIEAAVVGLPKGLGGPMYDGLESKLAPILFGIPAVKGVEFGNGFEAATLRGSQNNDPFVVVSEADNEASATDKSDAVFADGKSDCNTSAGPFNSSIQTATNNHGGILGGITNGMPLITRVSFKPTPSIAKPQRSVNLKTMEEVTIQIKGRHDPCIVPRAVPVVEAAAAIAIYDLILGGI